MAYTNLSSLLSSLLTSRENPSGVWDQLGESAKAAAALELTTLLLSAVSTNNSQQLLWGGQDVFTLGGTAQRSIFIGNDVAYGSEVNTPDGLDACDNIIVGILSCEGLTTGRRNCVLGSYALQDCTTGSANIAIGYRALTNITTGVNNVGIGDGTQMNTTSSYNCTNVGIEAGLATGTDEAVRDVTCFGYHAGYGSPFTADKSSGSWSTWIGSGAGGNMRADSTHENTTAIGALAGVSGGTNCVFVGYRAGSRGAADNEFYLDALDRSSNANEKVQSLMYGTFAADPANQTLRVNADTSFTYGVDLNSTSRLIQTLTGTPKYSDLWVDTNGSVNIHSQYADLASFPVLIVSAANSGAHAILRLNSGADNQYRNPIIQFYSAGTFRWAIGQSYNATPAGSFSIAYDAVLNANRYFVLTAAGKCGIGGVDNPATALAVNGDVLSKPAASITPANNGELVVEATDNTTLTFKLKGTDGVVRTGTIALS